jgi:Mg2+ and Co2+ transporter CorA
MELEESKSKTITALESAINEYKEKFATSIENIKVLRTDLRTFPDKTAELIVIASIFDVIKNAFNLLTNLGKDLDNIEDLAKSL